MPMIAGEIRRYLRDNSVMRVSRGMRDIAYRALQVKERLTAERGQEPDLDEIARELEGAAPVDESTLAERIRRQLVLRLPQTREE